MFFVTYIMIKLCYINQQNSLLNPLNAQFNPIWHLLALLGAHHIFHVSGLRVKFEGCAPAHPSTC